MAQKQCLIEWRYRLKNYTIIKQYTPPKQYKT